MRFLKDVYPNFASGVDFLAVGFDPSENATTLDQYRQAQGWPWPVYDTNGALGRALEVRTQATKFVVDGNGVILWRAGYGVVPASEWGSVLERAVAR